MNLVGLNKRCSLCFISISFVQQKRNDTKSSHLRRCCCPRGAGRGSCAVSVITARAQLRNHIHVPHTVLSTQLHSALIYSLLTHNTLFSLGLRRAEDVGGDCGCVQLCPRYTCHKDIRTPVQLYL